MRLLPALLLDGKLLGGLGSRPLATAILAIYLGERTADANLKKGMLGK